MRRFDCLRARPLLVALGFIAGALQGCSTVSNETGGAPQGAGQQASLAEKVLLGNANPAPITDPEDLAFKQSCPPIEILQGAAAFPVYDKPGDTDPFSLRYQARIADTARECSKLGVEAGIRVGVVGRVAIGPKGAPGSFRLPLRIAVVDDKSKPVYSQVHMIDVTVPAGQGAAEFSHIEDNIVVPIPANQFREWRILVGYDPQGAEPSAKAARRRG